LRENIWKNLLKLIEGQTDSKDLQVKYEMLLNLPKALVNDVTVSEVESNLYLRSVHKTCHKTIDRELNSKETQWKSNIKKHLNKELFKAIREFRDGIKTEIKKYRKLTKSQIEEISSHRNLSSQ